MKLTLHICVRGVEEVGQVMSDCFLVVSPFKKGLVLSSFY